MEYIKQNWSSNTTAKAKRSFAAQRQAVESLVAVANTSETPTKVAKSSPGGERAGASLEAPERFTLLKYLKAKPTHRATISEVAETLQLPADQLADMLLDARADGLVKLTKTSGETEAILVES